jgi:hypothetical protein
MQSWLESLHKKERIFFPYSSPIEGIKLIVCRRGCRFGFVGAFSVSSKKIKVYAINEPVYTFGDFILIGTEIAKLLIYLNSPPKGYRKLSAELLDKTPPPLYANPWHGDAVYLDIKSCYYHLIEKLYGIKYARQVWLGLDLEVKPWHVPEDIKPILEEHKSIRNSIYGLLRAKVMITWKREEDKITFHVKSLKNPFFYPDVPLAIMDITHALATVAVKKFNCQYVAIDGFILPEKEAMSFKEYLESLNFRVGIRAYGSCFIKNFYSYAIGDTKTKTFDIYGKAEKTQSNLLFSLDEAEDILRKFKPLLLRNP